MATEPVATSSNYVSAPVPPIAHESDQEVRVRRGELRDWAKEVEHVMRSPIEAPSLWKAAGIGVSISALFYGLSLIPAYAPKDAPSPSAWVVLPAVFLFLAGIVLYLFTAHVEQDAERMNVGHAEMLANKIRQADSRHTEPTGNLDDWFERAGLSNLDGW